MILYNATIKNDGRAMNRAFSECSLVTKHINAVFMYMHKKEENLCVKYMQIKVY